MARLDPATWAVVRAQYLGGVPLAELEARHGVRRQSVCRAAKREGWGAHGSLAGDVLTAATEGVKAELVQDFTKRAKLALEQRLATCDELASLLAAEVQAIKEQSAAGKLLPGGCSRTLKTLAQTMRELLAAEAQARDLAGPQEQEKPKTDFDRFQELVALAAEAGSREGALDVLTGGNSGSD